MTEMDITYIFIKYISVTIRRHSKAFNQRRAKVSYYECKEFIENIELEKRMEDLSSSPSNYLYPSYEEKVSYQKLLLDGISSLDEMELYIIREKFLHQRSDSDIGKDFSVSGQMISRRKRNILSKLKNFFLESLFMD